MQKLSNATAGKYTIKWIFTDPELSQLLKSIRIEAGKEIQVISSSRFGSILLRSEAGAFLMDREALAGVTV